MLCIDRVQAAFSLTPSTKGTTVDDLGDQLRPVQRSPLFLRGHRQLEHHRQAGQSAARALGLLRA